MRQLLILICLLLTTVTVTAQFGRQRQNRLGRQQPNTPPTENQKAAFEKKAAERQAEFIANFISTLEADEFQKEIAKQTVTDYFTKAKEFAKIPFENSAQRKDAFEALKKEHFLELRTLFSKKDNEQLDKFLKGEFEEKEAKKKKKKRKKKKKN